ncbi:MAG: aspartate/glutamate racemase family protein [Lonepinella koalarum]|nr:aspartate/glutamate racemase family protein [Lonepinella koalarum]
MKTLGILGGMSPESTVTYYTEINRAVNQAAGGNSSAPLLIASVNFADIVACQKQGDWQLAGEILAEAAKKLEYMGAEGILLATNTMHKVASQIVDQIKVPFLHILDAVTKCIRQQGLHKVALLGTSFTMSDRFYIEGLQERGISAIVPETAVQAEIHRIIFDELCVGKILPESKNNYLNTISELQKQGAEGVILGCTEIGLLIQQEDSVLPFFDSAKLHAQMAVEFILSQS